MFVDGARMVSCERLCVSGAWATRISGTLPLSVVFAFDTRQAVQVGSICRVGDLVACQQNMRERVHLLEEVMRAGHNPLAEPPQLSP